MIPTELDPVTRFFDCPLLLTGDDVPVPFDPVAAWYGLSADYHWPAVIRLWPDQAATRQAADGPRRLLTNWVVPFWLFNSPTAAFPAALHADHRAMRAAMMEAARRHDAERAWEGGRRG